MQIGSTTNLEDYITVTVADSWRIETKDTNVQIVRNVAEYSGIHSRGNIKGVLSDCVERLVLHLVHGDRVTIDDLGTFSISLKCKGAATVASFSNKNIKEVNIVFTPCKKLKETLAAAEFKQTKRQ